MTTIYGCYFTSIDETDWFATRKAAELHGSTSGDEYIMRESVGYVEDL
jgi:hypothetical protein